MKLSHCPHEVTIRLLELTERAEQLGLAADQAEANLARARDILGGKLTPANTTKADILRLRETFDATHKAALDARAAAQVENRLLHATRAWVASLPADIELKPAAVEPDGADLESVRARLAAARRRLQQLRALPQPSDDLGKRVTDFVESLRVRGAPVVRGIAAGQALEVWWPLSGAANARNLDGYDRSAANPLLFAAWHDPAALADSLLAVIERDVNQICAPSLRDEEIAKLEHEIAELLYLDTALVDRVGNGATYNPDCTPQALLQVALQERSSAAA